MVKGILVPIAAGFLIVEATMGARTTHASDRELLAVLDRAACVPDRVVSNKLSATVTVYEVTCKRSGRVLQVACVESSCFLQVRSREEDEP
jgi:hypothetical protein